MTQMNQPGFGILNAILQAGMMGQERNNLETDNERKIQQLLKARTEDHMDAEIKRRDMMEAQGQMNDPDYFNWKRQGYTGQMKSQDAAGNKAQALSEGDIKKSKLQQATDFLREQERANAYAAIVNGAGSLSQDGGQIGFNMQPDIEGFPQGTQQPSAAQRAFNFGGGGATTLPPGAVAKERNMGPLMGNFYRSGDSTYAPEGSGKLQGTTPEARAAEYQRLMAEGPQNAARPPSGIPAGNGTMPTGQVPTSWSGPGGAPTPSASPAPVLSNMARGGGLGNKPTPYSDLIPKTGKYAQMAGLDALTPEFVGKMAGAEQRIDSAEDIANKRAEAQMQAAKGQLKDKKYNEQKGEHQLVIARAAVKAQNGEKLTEKELAQYMESTSWMQQHTYIQQVASGANFRQPLVIPGNTGIERGPSPIQQGAAGYPGAPGLPTPAAPGAPQASPNAAPPGSATPKLTPEQRAAMIKQIQQGK